MLAYYNENLYANVYRQQQETFTSKLFSGSTNSSTFS